jgi:hypothetical protein
MNRLSTLLFGMLLALPVMSGLPSSPEPVTYPEVLQLAKEQSPQAILAKHRFRAAYWEYRTFVAEYRPTLSMNGTIPEFSRSLIRYQNPDGPTATSRRTPIPPPLAYRYRKI